MAPPHPSAPIPPLLSVRCPSCGTDHEVEYVMLGVRVDCGACGQAVRMERILGLTSPNTGYAITFGAAETLFHDHGRRDRVAPIVGQTGHVLLRSGAATELLDIRGEPADPILVHRMIQSRPELQLDLYQLYMDLIH